MVLQLLSDVHGLHRLPIVFETHPTEWCLPHLLLLRILVVLEELGLPVQIERCFSLASHVVTRYRLVYLIVAADVLTFRTHSIVCSRIGLTILWRHLVQVVRESLIVESDEIVDVATLIVQSHS